MWASGILRDCSVSVRAANVIPIMAAAGGKFCVIIELVFTLAAASRCFASSSRSSQLWSSRPTAASGASSLTRSTSSPLLRARDEDRIRRWCLSGGIQAVGFRFNSSAAQPPAKPTKKPGFLSRILPDMSLEPAKGSKRTLDNEENEQKDTSSSIRKLIDLARPEKRQLGIAVGLVSLMRCLPGEIEADRVQLLVSSSVSMLVPLTIGKLIDFFSSPDAVRRDRLVEQR